MKSPEIQILIPCHSFEDFPTEQTDELAASLLNVFAVAFHPGLLAWTAEMPRWRRADDPPQPSPGQLVLIPTVSSDWLPCSWADDARQAGATVVTGLSDRSEMLTVALGCLSAGESPLLPADENLETAPCRLDPSIDGPEPQAGLVEVDDSLHPSADPEPDDIDPVFEDLAADFMALGTCWLLVELLTRRMRQFGNVDETRFFQRAHAGAKAAMASDRETAVAHLNACFEMLLEARERFYPVDCYLIDLCLAVPDIDCQSLVQECGQTVPFTLLVTPDDLREICQKTPELESLLKQCQADGRMSFIGGEDREANLPLLPLESVLYHLRRGRRQWQEFLGTSPVVWGRRRFGLTPLLPQLLVKFGFIAAMHVVLDDGIYPDAEYTKLRWRGVDGTLIDAFSRIPLAAEGAASYLRFPVRMAESMDHDQVAGLILARWPEIQAPWFDDLRRSQKYAPCLGRFITLDRFFEQTELPGQVSTHKANEYFSPYLIQHVARRERDPISRYTYHTSLRRQFDSAIWYQATANVLLDKPVDMKTGEDLEAILESAVTDPSSNDDLAAKLHDLYSAGSASLSRVIMHSAASGHGYLILNSLSFSRRVVVRLPGLQSPPPVSGAIKAVEFDASRPDLAAAIVEVPGSGYAWIPSASPHSPLVVPKQPLAEDWMLRNDHFEVALNQRTGGIAHVRLHHQRAKRVSQQLSFRFPRERVVPSPDESGESSKSQYAEMRCLGHEVVRSGTACGEVMTFGEIIDQAKNERLASFKQTVRVWRGLPSLELEIELIDVKVPEGDPWNNYFASRFAWGDSTAAVTRSVFHSAQPFAGERFETSDYVEIASETERLTIIPHGLAFHRKTGDRMLDSLLITAGETGRRFRFTVTIDHEYPLEAAWSAMTPAAVIPTESGPPRSGVTGWFYHLDGKHAQITRVLDAEVKPAVTSPLEEYERVSVPSDPGFAVRIVETEGLSKPVRLRCFRQPTYARKRDFLGATLSELLIEGDAVVIDLSAFEVADVELRFARS